MSPIIERIARALCCPERECEKLQSDGTCKRNYTFLGEARASVAAMRDPTKAMLEAGNAAVRGATVHEAMERGDLLAWQAMIDAALK